MCAVTRRPGVGLNESTVQTAAVQAVDTWQQQQQGGQAADTIYVREPHMYSEST